MKRRLPLWPKGSKSTAPTFAPIDRRFLGGFNFQLQEKCEYENFISSNHDCSVFVELQFSLG
jgi:hypothetical protein